MRARWLPLIVGGKWNPLLFKAAHQNSGVYAIRRRLGGMVEYVGESHTGRVWKTLQRHFQDHSGKFEDRSEYTAKGPESFDVALWITSQGARAKKNGDQKALDLQAKLIARYRPTQNRDDGQAYEKCPHGTTSWRCARNHLSPQAKAAPMAADDFAFGANVNPAVPPPNVAPEKRAENRTPDLFTGRTRLEDAGKGARRDWKGAAEQLARELAECRAKPTTTTEKPMTKKEDDDAEGYESGQREISDGNMTPAEARRYLEEVKPRAGDAFDAGHRRAFTEHAAKVKAPKPEGFGDVDGRGQASMFKRNPRGGLVMLGELVELVWSGGKQRFPRRRPPIVAYDAATGRLALVFAPAVTGRGSPKGAKEYERTHWGQGGKGQRLEGFTLAGKAPKLGRLLEITYATRKGDDGELVNYWHKFGDFGSETPWHFIPPGLSCAKVEGVHLYRVDGGTYKVKAHGIVG